MFELRQNSWRHWRHFVLIHKSNNFWFIKMSDDFTIDISTDIGREILSFLIPESKTVKFHKHSPNTFNDAYSSKYERAHINYSYSSFTIL